MFEVERSFCWSCSSVNMSCYHLYCVSCIMIQHHNMMNELWSHHASRKCFNWTQLIFSLTTRLMMMMMLMLLQLRWFNHCLEQSSCNNLLHYYQINHAESLSFAIALKYLRNPFQSQANPVVFKISLVFFIELKQNKIKKTVQRKYKIKFYLIFLNLFIV